MERSAGPLHPVEDVLLGAGLQWPTGQGMPPEWNTREMLPAAGSNPLNHADQSPASQAKVMQALRASEHEKAAEGTRPSASRSAALVPDPVSLSLPASPHKSRRHRDPARQRLTLKRGSKWLISSPFQSQAQYLRWWSRPSEMLFRRFPAFAQQKHSCGAARQPRARTRSRGGSVTDAPRRGWA